MKKILIFSLIFIVLLVAYVCYSTNKINGVWIEVYKLTNPNSKSDFTVGKDKMLIWSSLSVLDIKNCKTKRYDASLEGKEPFEKKHFFINNRFFPSLWNETEKEFVKKLTKDSLVLSNNHNHLMIYKKIPDSLKNNSKINLINKHYQIIAQNSIDTVFFEGSYLKIKNPNEKWDSSGWELIHAQGFEILLTGFDTAFVIKKINGKLFLYKPTMGKDFKQFQLNEIQEE